MSDKPIPFSAPMVRALIAGTKTQTRRLHKIYYANPGEGRTPKTVHYLRIGNVQAGPFVRDPAYKVGDRLYVREHWRTFVSLDKVAPVDLLAGGRGAGVLYIADGGGMALTADGSRTYGDRDNPQAFGRDRRAMHMPRWASRITLTVTDVRVQRLQDISEADAIAEGVEPERDGWRQYGSLGPMHAGSVWATAAAAYHDLWDSINGIMAWDANPWVAAYTFTVAMGNIDAQ